METTDSLNTVLTIENANWGNSDHESLIMENDDARVRESGNVSSADNSVG